jgi:alkylation response protein AidB-like acyl-CoA dehydrogenase
MFLVKADSPGISLEPLQPLAGARKNVMHYDNVTVPLENMIGRPEDGWAVAQASLAGERGGTSIIEPCRLYDELLEYCRNTKTKGGRLVNDPNIRMLLTDLYIESKMLRLLYYRTFWETSHGIYNYYEGASLFIYAKAFYLRLATVARQILGPTAIVTDPKWAALGGKIEFLQRWSLETHGAGTVEASKITFARALDLPRSRRR